jgi:hypothetical protein
MSPEHAPPGAASGFEAVGRNGRERVGNVSVLKQFFVVALVAGFALAQSGTGRAADLFIFDSRAASPGDRVTVKSATAGSETTPVRLVLYLVRNEIADTVRSPRDRRLIRLGVIAVDNRGRGSLSFVVPDVDGGAYVLAHRRIGPCGHRGICGAPFYAASVGDDIIPRYRPLMTLRVEQDDSYSVWLVGVAALAAVALGLSVWRRWRPRRSLRRRALRPT